MLIHFKNRDFLLNNPFRNFRDSRTHIKFQIALGIIPIAQETFL